MKQVTSPLRVSYDGEDEKCCVDAVKLSIQPYTSMSVQDASDGFSKLLKGICLDEDVEDENLHEDEGNLVSLPNTNAAAGQVIFHGADVTDLPKGFKLTKSQKECVDIMRKDMDRGQMLLLYMDLPVQAKLQQQGYWCQRRIWILCFQGLRELLHLYIERKRLTLCCIWDRMLRISKSVKSGFHLR